LTYCYLFDLQISYYKSSAIKTRPASPYGFFVVMPCLH